jgi:hypothetical protein
MTEDQLKIGLKVRMAMSWKRDVCRSTNKTGSNWDMKYKKETVRHYANREGQVIAYSTTTTGIKLIKVMWGEGGYANPTYHYAQELDVVPE